MALKIRSNPTAKKTLHDLHRAEERASLSLQRLASGQKINSGKDDPAGLVISENLRGQIAGVQQAIDNSEMSISMVQTAEGALTEVSNLMIQMRQLSLAAANEGGNDNASLVAMQNELENALDAVDRVSRFTQFGDKQLLDGSQGVSGVANGEDLIFVEASERTKTSPVTGYLVDITQVAQSAQIVEDFDDSSVEDLKVILREGGRNAVVAARGNDTAADFVSRLRGQVDRSGLALNVQYDQDEEVIRISHKNLGSNHSFQVVTNKDGVLTESANLPVRIANGTDVRGTINGEGATGVGAVLVGNSGNASTSDLAIAYLGENTGQVGTVSVSQNSLVFQVGPNPGQQVSVSINNMSTNSLGRGIPNLSGFSSLAELDITTPQGAQDSIKFIDAAMMQLSDLRGRLGAFQRHTLETNVSTLRITAENLIAAESSIRDTNIAEEIANFTKQRILTETAAASLAQANSIQNHSLMILLRDL